MKIRERKTKIVCTIGPKTASKEMLRALIDAGMDVVRLNFSHGDYDFFKNIIKEVRFYNPNIAIMGDTKGTEIRTGVLANDYVDFNKGDEIEFTCEEFVGDNKRICIDYDKLEELDKGNKLLIDDGKLEFEVIERIKGGVRARALNSARLGNKKTVTIKGHKANLPSLTDKDRKDILFCIDQGVDFIAASFVREPMEVIEFKEFIQENGSDMKVISKIENQDAIENIDGIISVSDGIMVARGDLGVETQLEEVALFQKEIISKCNLKGIPVITATHMLESMTKNPRPTRAEVSDVTNAILDGTDALMLSGETAAGDYPLESVKMMDSIARLAEKRVFHKVYDLPSEVDSFVFENVSEATFKFDIGCIITPTDSGRTPRNIAKHKPKQPIIAVAKNDKLVRQLMLSWGVFPVLVKYRDNEDFMKVGLKKIVEDLKKENVVSDTTMLAIVAGSLINNRWVTNLLSFRRVDEIL